MKHKQKLWMSNLSCGIMCSVPGSLTGSFCHDLCSPSPSAFYGHPHVHSHSLSSFLTCPTSFSYKALCGSPPQFSITSFSAWPLFFISLSLSMIPIQAIHTLHHLTLPPYCSSLSSLPPFISSGIPTPFLGHSCFAAAWARQFLTTLCLSTHSLLCGPTNKDWGLPCLAPTWAMSIHHFSQLFLALIFCFLQSSLVTGTL